MGEIGTHSMIKSKVSNYQYTGNYCPTTTEINTSGTAKVNGFYGGNECPMINSVEIPYLNEDGRYSGFIVDTTLTDGVAGPAYAIKGEVMIGDNYKTATFTCNTQVKLVAYDGTVWNMSSFQLQVNADYSNPTTPATYRDFVASGFPGTFEGVEPPYGLLFSGNRINVDTLDLYANGHNYRVRFFLIKS